MSYISNKFKFISSKLGTKLIIQILGIITSFNPLIPIMPNDDIEVIFY